MTHQTTSNQYLVAIRHIAPKKQQNNGRQFSSFILFLSAVILVNLCPFHDDDTPFETTDRAIQSPTSDDISLKASHSVSYLNNYMTHLDTCLKFVKLMFSNPVRLGQRTTRFTQAEARMLGKMAKVWYIKKKIKKLSKKLKKHTIAVPVFTAIPIYEHSYYPQPHVTHVTHGMHHAASSYVPSVVAAPGAPTAQAGSTTQQLITSASNTNQNAAPTATAYKISTAPSYPHAQHRNPPAMYVPMHAAASAHQIINAYPPGPPLYVDEAGGLYGHYGNAYGRYDGGYQMW